MLVVGEALVDVVVGADTTLEAPGGSPLNVAVGLARLDTPARLLTQLGTDAHGDLLRRHLAANGVPVDAEPTPSGRTSVAVAQLDAEGVASYEFDIEWGLAPRELPLCAGLHVGSLGTLLQPGASTVRDLVSQAAARELFVSYDPNLRAQFVRGHTLEASVRALASDACVVKISEEDCGLLVPNASVDEVARSLLEGVRTRAVLLTRGPDGASLYTRRSSYDVDAPFVEVVDTVGAGDAFMAALLAQLDESGAIEDPRRFEDEAMLRRAVRAAVVYAALTCERRGAAPPWRRELPAGWPD